MNGPVMHPTFWSTTLEFLLLIVLPIVIVKWPHKNRSGEVKSRPLPDAPNPREERAGYVEAKMQRFEKPR